MAGIFINMFKPLGRSFPHTTALHVIASVLCAGVGVWVYAAGYTYEGSLLVYLIPVCIIGLPYLMAAFRWPMPVLGTLGLMPVLMAIQNGGVDAGNWQYSADKRFLLGHVTETGEGPLQWTRVMWTGTVLPVIEYLFYPLMGCFMLSAFALFVQWAPPALHVVSARSRHVFTGVFGLMTAAMVYLLLTHDKPVMDHNWYLISVGFINGWMAMGLSPSFRKVVSLRSWWLWLVVMGCGIQPLWEFGHSCLNHDWVYVPARVMPILYTFNGAPISILQPLGYVGVAITFPALTCLMHDLVPRWVLAAESGGTPFDTLMVTSSNQFEPRQQTADAR